MMDATDQQLEMFYTMLKTPTGFRIISGEHIKLYAEAIFTCTGERMVIRPIRGVMSQYEVILPY